MSMGEEFRDFMTECTDPYSFNLFARRKLVDAGFTEIFEGSFPDEIPDKGFFIRDGKSLLAFNIGGFESAVITGAHCDSPMLKMDPKMDGAPSMVHGVNYAGGLSYSFIGRDMTVGGAVLIKDESGNVKIKNVVGKEPVAFIPFKTDGRESREYKLNRDTDLDAVICASSGHTLRKYVADLVQVPEEQIVGHDLCLIDSRPATLFGDFISSPRLDNLNASFACLKAFIESNPQGTINICAVFDAEEIGSRTRAGALSDMVESFLKVICRQRKVNMKTLIANSLMLSADAAHAEHPNYPDCVCKLNKTPAGCGVVIKMSYKATYAYDERGFVLVREAAKRSGAKYTFVGNKNGRRGGGTIGPKVEANLQIATVDIGAAVWGMHSHREMMAWKDVEAEVQFITYVYNNFSELYKWANGDL